MNYTLGQESTVNLFNICSAVDNRQAGRSVLVLSACLDAIRLRSIYNRRQRMLRGVKPNPTWVPRSSLKRHRSQERNANRFIFIRLLFAGSRCSQIFLSHKNVLVFAVKWSPSWNCWVMGLLPDLLQVRPNILRCFTRVFQMLATKSS